MNDKAKIAESDKQVEEVQERAKVVQWIDDLWEGAAWLIREYGGYIIWFLIVLVVWIFWYAFGASFLNKLICADAETCVELERMGQVGDLFGGINAFFAALAFAAVAYSSHLARKVYQSDRQHGQDALYMEQVKASYAWAYSAFTNDKETAPLNERESWLTTARHLIRAKQIESYIQSPAYQLIVEEQREYWRRRFSKAIQKIEQIPNLMRDYLPGLEPTSVKVVINFSHWHDERKDTIEWAETRGDRKSVV